jgi:hypothetical protein
LEALLDDEDVNIQEVIELIHRIAPVSPGTNNQMVSSKSLLLK